MVHSGVDKAWADCVLGVGRGRCSIRLIGGFELKRDGDSVELPWAAERVLAFLALRDASLDRSYVAGSLWPELTDARARANLRTALWRLRDRTCSPVELRGSGLGLAGHVFVDLHEARQVARRLLQEPERASLSDCRHRALHWDLLPDWYDEWVTLERERYRHLRQHSLEAACRMLTQLARYGEAIQAGVSATHAEPMRESAHRALIDAHLAEGNAESAFRQYEHFRELLAREVGAEPSEQMESSLRAIDDARRGGGRALAEA